VINTVRSQAYIYYKPMQTVTMCFGGNHSGRDLVGGLLLARADVANMRVFCFVRTFYACVNRSGSTGANRALAPLQECY